MNTVTKHSRIDTGMQGIEDRLGTLKVHIRYEERNRLFIKTLSNAKLFE